MWLPLYPYPALQLVAAMRYEKFLPGDITQPRNVSSDIENCLSNFTAILQPHLNNGEVT